jgi:hypothetical protein
VVEDCEAFLAGRYVELCESRGEPVPVWAWLNLLAHGNEDDLRAAAGRRATAVRWRQAQTFLAGELVDLVDAARVPLAAFQRDVLVPLELDVISCPGASRWLPGQLVSGLLGVLPDKGRRQLR